MENTIIKVISLLAIMGWVSHAYANNENNWIIENKTNGFSYNTLTKSMSSKGIHAPGLISVSKQGNIALKNYWQEGAYRSTMTFNEKVIVDGYDIYDVSRIGSFRFDRKGDFVYIRSTKGPKALVKLIYNDDVILTWPRLTKVKIVAFKPHKMIVSVYDEKTRSSSFFKYPRSPSGEIETSYQMIGQLKNCSILSAKPIKTGILLQTYCDAQRGSDIQLLEFSTHNLTQIMASQDDNILAFHLKDKKNKKHKNSIPILSLSGTTSALQLYHATTGSLMKMTGEPMSLASDEAGKQSWSQSYRTLSLAELYEKTQHNVFAKLASQAMQATLRQQNKFTDIKQPHNPDCAWASRIYSIDSKTPLSFMINQAMISNSLIKSCKKLATHCTAPLKRAIDQNASCLVNAYEYLFMKDEGLYRIPYGSKFRYDGIWAPWNWHLTWAGVLRHVASLQDNDELDQRALNIVEKFINTWEFTQEQTPRILWRYWPPLYYQGWSDQDKVSFNRPKQNPKNLAKQRYEDLNHAGISLLGLSYTNYHLSPEISQGLQNSMTNLLKVGTILPRDMNGDGPHNPRWALGAGWHQFATPALNQLYTHQLPGNVSSNKHLAYALLSDPKAKFELTLTLSYCALAQCETQQTWSWSSMNDFIASNPLFEVKKENVSIRYKSAHTNDMIEVDYEH